MKRPSLHEKLIRAARNNSPGDEVPYAFEQRVMANLHPEPVEDWSAIMKAWWCAAAACVAVAVGISIWTYAFGRGEPSPNFSSELEQTILASLSDYKLDPEIDSLENDWDLPQLPQ